ncbi:inactive protein RESTRICTED TEV MOVEMENT 2-like isoform X2 [Prosopis cineraria]|uniref:inactive protein RESTRICTED TEV MOVEMENT 2-like isoform X2 n=1 Tax=Prosopis cineraria TaxID=364024 RepID=UPI00241089D9|nr:inactive protein RESTRICTED TEV MOVEMENT 2-like isoform X2 [Prosopis cineraria]
METGSLEPRNRFYEVFEPHCKWNTFETLDIDLKGFRTEQVKVQINHNRGMLLIHGERPLGATNKWTRFHKNIKLSEDSNLSEIRAKFSDVFLSIVVPKQVNEPVNDVVVAGSHGRSSGGE